MITHALGDTHEGSGAHGSPTLISAGLAFPDPAGPPERDYALVVQGERISAAGPLAVLRAAYPAAPISGGAGYVLIPALVNSHDHGRGLGTLPLGVPDDLLEIWLPGLWAQPPLNPYLAALYDGLLLLRAGVGTVAHSHNPRDWRRMDEEAAATIRGYRDAGIRVAFHPPMVDWNQLVYAERERFLAGLPPALHPAAARFLAAPPLSRDEYLGLCGDLLRRHHDPAGHTVHIQVSPAGGQWCSDELIADSVTFARAHGTRVQMHLLETRYQRAYAQRRWGQSFVRHLDAIGALGPWLTLAHMVWVEPEDLALLAARGVGVAHNPSSNLRLRSGIAPLRAMLAAGLSVGVGLDGQALDDDQDMLRELRLAWSLADLAEPEAGPLMPGALLGLGTSGGAAITLGPEAPLGRLAPGALADLVLIKRDKGLGGWALALGRPALADAPPDHALALLLRGASRRHVSHVMVGGRWVVRNGRSITQDEGSVAAAMTGQLARPADANQRAAAADARALAPYLREFYCAYNL
jgi:5-methylthioadenosine/S-adenosylhomocysteine deaminase